VVSREEEGEAGKWDLWPLFERFNLFAQALHSFEKKRDDEHGDEGQEEHLRDGEQERDADATNNR
jgi:hypothetical protein